MAKEKEFTRLRDELSRERRELPFDGKTQLIVYHFMFAPEWEAGCSSCSFWTDNFNGIDVHLKHRDTSFVAIFRMKS